MRRPVGQPSRSQFAYGRKVVRPRRAALRRALPRLMGDTKASAANRSSRASASNVSTTWGAVTAGAPLPLHALRVRPEEDKAVQERVPIGRLKLIVQCAHKSGGWHRSLIADHYAVGQPNVVRSVHAKQHVALQLRDAREIKQAFGAHQTMLEDRSQVVRLREVIELSDTPPHASDLPADSVFCWRHGISSLRLLGPFLVALDPGVVAGRGRAARSSEYARTRASSVKLRLRPLGLGSIHAVVPPNADGHRPQSISDWPVIMEKPRLPRNAIERGA